MILLSDVSSSTTGPTFTVVPGRKIGLYSKTTGQIGGVMVEGSIDGFNWFELPNPLNGYAETNGVFQYIRGRYDDGGYSGTVQTLQAIQSEV